MVGSRVLLLKAPRRRQYSAAADFILLLFWNWKMLYVFPGNGFRQCVCVSLSLFSAFIFLLSRPPSSPLLSFVAQFISLLSSSSLRTSLSFFLSRMFSHFFSYLVLFLSRFPHYLAHSHTFISSHFPSLLCLPLSSSLSILLSFALVSGSLSLPLSYFSLRFAFPSIFRWSSSFSCSFFIAYSHSSYFTSYSSSSPPFPTVSHFTFHFYFSNFIPISPSH